MGNRLWRGEKTLLRAFSQRDVELFIGMIDDPDDEADRLGDQLYLPRSPEHRREILQGRVLHPENPEEFYRFMIDDLEGNTVGTLSVQNMDARCGTFECGFVVFAPHRGKGYAKDALTVVLSRYFGEKRFVKCTNTVYGYNLASIAMHESYGFALEGRIRRGVFSRGRHHDVLLYGMTDDEFFARHPEGQDA